MPLPVVADVGASAVTMGALNTTATLGLVWTKWPQCSVFAYSRQPAWSGPTPEKTMSALPLSLNGARAAATMTLRDSSHSSMRAPAIAPATVTAVSPSNSGDRIVPGETSGDG